MTVVLDASALLVLLFDEPGAARVEDRLAAAAVSTVNLAETHAKMLERGFPPTDARFLLGGLGLRVVPLDEADAWVVGELREPTRRLGLSLGDRACLALALRENCPALTADRAWAGLDIGVEIEVIR